MTPSIEDARRKLQSDNADEQRAGVALVEQLHAAGDALAAYAIGTWFLHGSHGYPRAPEKAAPYLQYAAERRAPEAAYDLATLIEEDRLGARPRRDAFGYYVVAAAMGDRDAIEEVARCFYWGIGTFRNKAAAERLHDLLSAPTAGQLAAE